MAKQFKLRISKLLTSLTSCRSSKHQVPKTTHFSHSPPPVPSPPPPTPPGGELLRHVPVVISYGCGCRSFSRAPPPEAIPAYLWRKEDEWHVVVNADHGVEVSSLRRKIDSDDGSDLFPPLAIPRPSFRKTKNGKRRKKKKKREKENLRRRAPNSTSEEEDSRLFLFSSEEEEEEYETLIGTSNSSPEPAVGGKVGESVAVVKRSEDPRADFRRSMMEMVVEKEIYEAAELEQLLRCFLSLNSGDHHRSILVAFSEMLTALSDDEHRRLGCK